MSNNFHSHRSRVPHLNKITEHSLNKTKLMINQLAQMISWSVLTMNNQRRHTPLYTCIPRMEKICVIGSSWGNRSNIFQKEEILTILNHLLMGFFPLTSYAHFHENKQIITSSHLQVTRRSPMSLTLTAIRSEILYLKICNPPTDLISETNHTTIKLNILWK